MSRNNSESLLALAGRLGLGPLAAPASRPAALVVAACGLAGLLLVLFFGPGAALADGSLAVLEVGRVAERDIVAEREISYVDEKATRLRAEAEERLVLPIFVVDEKSGRGALERLAAFRDLLLELSDEKLAPETLFLRVQRDFPGAMARDEILALARFPQRAQALAQAESILARLLQRGVAAVPSTGLEGYNPDYVELRQRVEGRLEVEEIPLSRLPTLRGLAVAVEEELLARRLQRPLAGHAAAVVRAFAVENAFFDADQSSRRLEGVRRRVLPVIRSFAKGERIIKKGFVVTESDFERLRAARAASAKADWGRLAGDAGFYLATLLLALLILGPGLSGCRIRPGELYLAAGAALAFLLAALLLSRFGDLPGELSLPLLLPTALLAMLFSVLAGQRFAVLYGLVLSLLILLASGFDARAFAFALLSAAAGAFAARGAQSRIDLVRAALLLGLLQALAAAVLAAPAATSASLLLLPVLGGAANGFLTGLLCLGFLPIIEHALNVPTRFRLMELSDLNAPILKRLLTVAPGTYAHSVTVAHLAESACRSIGADPLLARVGAYYHDIGKIEQPEYFVENQSGYNKHDELNPRLSATVIRSHVKLGAERARSLGLPSEVVDIVAQHHGDSLIAWFYDRAQKADEGVDPEDFSYPGEPPSSREGAVVMLADAVEAASRTLAKPSLARLEQYIGEIVADKVANGQLDRSPLTLRDLDAVKAAFTRILAGHFHSRIEYPKQREQQR